MVERNRIRTLVFEEDPNIKSKIKGLFHNDENYEIIAVTAEESRLYSLIDFVNPELILVNNTTLTKPIERLKFEINKKYPRLKIDCLYDVLEKKYKCEIKDFNRFYKRIFEDKFADEVDKQLDVVKLTSLNDMTSEEILRYRYIKRITDLLLLLGFPASENGYKYAKDAILFSIEHQSRIGGFTKELYPEVGKINQTTGSCIERAIRHGIDSAWKKGRVYKANVLYDIDIFDEYQKPTVSEFISIMADKVKLDIYQQI